MDRPCSTDCGRQAERGAERCATCEAVMRRRTTFGTRGVGVVCAPPPAPRVEVPSAHQVEQPRPGRTAGQAAEERLRAAREAGELPAPAPRTVVGRARAAVKLAQLQAPPAMCSTEGCINRVDPDRGEELCAWCRPPPGGWPAPTTPEPEPAPDPREAAAALELEQQLEALDEPAAPAQLPDTTTPSTEEPMATEKPDRRLCSNCNEKPIRVDNKSGICHPCRLTLRYRDPAKLGGLAAEKAARQARAEAPRRREPAAEAAGCPPARPPLDPRALTFDELVGCLPELEKRARAALDHVARLRQIGGGGVIPDPR